MQLSNDFSFFAGFAAIYSCVLLGVLVVYAVAYWRIFEKAGRPGWWAIIPIWNTIVVLDIAGKPRWWVLLLFVPLVNLIVLVLVAIDFVKAFGKDELWAAGFVLFNLVIALILAFGDAEYIGLEKDKRKPTYDDYAPEY